MSDAELFAEYLTIDEAADYLDKDTNWIKRRIRNGDLTVYNDALDARIKLLLKSEIEDLFQPRPYKKKKK